MRYLIRLAYKGTAYHGWQKQINAHSVQGELELKLSLLLGSNTETLGCGRTDTGVHAREFYVQFDTEAQPDLNKLAYKLNRTLPDDIAVFEIFPVSESFNARFDAVVREYQYIITRIPDPFLTETAWYRYEQVDMDLMNRAAAMLLGNHDFECFSKVHTQVNHFECDVQHAAWIEKDHLLIFTIRANRFLRNMVRAIVGTLLEIGTGKITIEAFELILKSKNRSEAGQSVPAKGLFLTEVTYPESTGIKTTARQHPFNTLHEQRI